MDERDAVRAEKVLAASAMPGLRRAMELVTARRMVADGLMTEGELLSDVARMFIEVREAGLVELLAAQATLTWIAVESIAEGDAAAALDGVSRLLSLVEQAGVTP